jgi:hypothetical protein
MSWFKIDDQSAFHPKVMAAGNEAWGAFCRMGAYSSAHLTEGFIPVSIAMAITTRKVVVKLIEAGLLHESPGGYDIHDYLVYNPTAEAEKAKRQARAEAGRKGGLHSSQAKQQAKGQAIASANGEAKFNPVPVPVPVENICIPIGLGSMGDSEPENAPIEESPPQKTNYLAAATPAQKEKIQELRQELGITGKIPKLQSEASALISELVSMRRVRDAPTNSQRRLSPAEQRLEESRQQTKADLEREFAAIDAMYATGQRTDLSLLEPR